jgi:hypothetical protein
MTDTSLTLAALSLIFLVAIFVVSFLFLRKVSAKPSDQRMGTLGGRGAELTVQERDQIARRMEREAIRARREEDARARQEALETAKPSYYQEKLRKREEERLARENAEKDAERTKLESEAAEYNKWKNMISVTNQGNEDGGAVSVEEFVTYIQDNKIVNIENIASRFNLKPDDVVSRIHSLEAAGVLFGILDDRGKYIVISSEQIDSIEGSLKQTNKRWTIDELRNLVTDLTK